MKLKALALSIALAAGVFAANAQTAYKGNDTFIGIGGGIISTYNGGFNTPQPYGNIMIGRYITPVWGVRGVIGGPFQTLDPNIKGNGYDLTADKARGYSRRPVHRYTAAVFAVFQYDVDDARCTTVEVSCAWVVAVFHAFDLVGPQIG